MSMHIEGPWLSTTGKKKGKKQWASSEAKARAERLAREWRDNEARWKGMAPKFSSRPVEPKKTNPLTSSGPKFPPGREPVEVKSLDTGWVTCSKPTDKEYTGTKVKGIGTMHKSNAVPIFSDDEAIEISKMRR